MRRGQAMYTIGQVANIIAISKDKLRYYEEKGILMPKQNSENNYRKYDLQDIDTVLLIEFYRSLDLEFKTIEKIHKQGTIKNIKGILDRKRNEVIKEIDRLKAIVDRIEATKKGCDDIDRFMGKYTIRSMDPIKILGRISDFRAYDEFEIIHKNRNGLDDASIIKSMKRYIRCNAQGIESTEMLITKDMNNNSNEKDDCILQYEKCAYTILEDGLHKKDVMGEAFKESLEWIDKEGYRHKGIAIIGMLLMVNDEGIGKSYLEVYIPLQ